MLYTILIGLLVSVLVAWMVFVGLLWVAARRHHVALTSLLGVFTNTIRLLRALIGDRDVPKGVRRRLAFALVYCGQPINLIPDFIPVVGYLDNVVVACWALRSVVRLSGPEIVARHWQGSPETLEILYRALRIPATRREASLTRQAPAPDGTP